MADIRDVIIIGSGPAGLTAAIYAARANLSPLVIEGFQSGGMPGGQLMITGVVENFPGFPDGIDGQQLMANMRQQAQNAGAAFEMDDVASVDLSRPPFTLTTEGGSIYQTQSLIIATGATARRLPLESEQRLWGHGISACAVCDGALPVFRNQPLAVIGGGDSAVEEADHLTRFAGKVYLIHRRDQLRASSIMSKRAETNPKIELLWNKTVDEFLGDTMLSGLKLKDTTDGSVSKLQVAGAFEAIGHIPNTGFLDGQLDTDAEGYLVVAPGRSTTSVEGVFAAGDVRDPVYRQAVAAAGGGCMAALEAERWLALRE
jgi:thioredoxin reductase (NADPH)